MRAIIVDGHVRREVWRRAMLDILSRYWWSVVLRGAMGVLFGLLALIWPGATVLVLVVLFGAYSLVDGVLALAAAFMGGRTAAGSRGWLVVEGVAGVGLGILTFLWPGVTTLVLLWLISAWALVTGVLEIMAAIRLRREIENEWWLAIGGALSIVFGVLLAVWPEAGALTLVTLIGIYAIIFGVVLIVFGLRLRRMRPVAGVPGQRPL
jgi:uncharacterized membrane protein HdeD (DUF308 family)